MHYIHCKNETISVKDRGVIYTFIFFLDYNFYGIKIIIVFIDVYLIIDYIIKNVT